MSTVDSLSLIKTACKPCCQPSVERPAGAQHTTHNTQYTPQHIAQHTAHNTQYTAHTTAHNTQYSTTVQSFIPLEGFAQNNLQIKNYKFTQFFKSK